MKKIFLFASVISLGIAAQAQVNVGDAAVPETPETVITPANPVTPAKSTIEFTQSNHDFGNIIEGEIAKYEFTFKNTGSEAITLTKVKASCGCTTPIWTKEEVAPGETGIITAEYNSRGRVGTFHKSITVNSTGGNVVLTIKGVVISEPEKPKSPIIIGG